jgi:membrane protease YdiL (CAAX protease family)
LANNLIINNGLLEIGVFILLWLAVWFPLAIPLAILVKWRPWQPFSIPQKLTFVSSLYLIAPIIIWLFAKFKGVAFNSYGLSNLNQLFLSLLSGFALGILGLLIIFLLEYALKMIKFNWENINQFWSISLPILVLGLFIGFIEELIFRSFFIIELNQNFNLIISAVISSVIFALLHLIWEQKQTLPQIPGLFLMGLVLAIAMIVNQGNLGLAWGLHSSWVFALSCLDSLGLVIYQDDAPEWFVGINKQPLAGVSGLLCLFVTGLTLSTQVYR